MSREVRREEVGVWREATEARAEVMVDMVGWEEVEGAWKACGRECGLPCYRAVR